MGLSEYSLTTIRKPLSSLSRCKVPCDSPCCAKLCGEDNHCIFNIDTHENANSDSDGDEHTNKNCFKIIKNSCNNVYLFCLGGANGPWFLK